MKFIEKHAGELPENFKEIFSFFLLTFFTFILYLCAVECVWLFSRVTYFSNLNLIASLILVLNAASLLAVFSLLVTVVLSALTCLVKKHVPGSARTVLSGLLLSTPFILFALVTFVFFDRWAYSVFEHDVTVRGTAVNVSILSLFIILGLVGFLHNYAGIKRFAARKSIWIGLLALSGVALLSVSLSCVFESYDVSAASESEKKMSVSATDQKYPNIIILTFDALGKSRMGIFGYKYDNTPFLEKLGKESFIFSRAYSPANVTRPSIVAMMTGKSTLTTWVLYGGEILRGQDRYQSLPAILKKLGYYTVEMGDDSNTDPRLYNLDVSNSYSEIQLKPVRQTRSIVFANIFSRHFPDTAFWLNEIFSSHWDHLSFALGLSDHLLKARRAALALPSGLEINHDTALKRISTLLRTKDQPLFVHYHSIVTHVPYRPTNSKFSQNDNCKDNLYADCVLDVDNFVEAAVEELKKQHKWSNTLLVVTTDHPFEHNPGPEPIPLIIHFPGQEKEMTVKENASLIDILPTICDYLGVPKKEWMEGESLLNAVKRQKEKADPSQRIIVKTWAAHFPKLIQKKRLGSIHLVCGDYAYHYNALRNEATLHEITNEFHDFLNTRDVSSEHPEIVKKLSAHIQELREKKCYKQYLASVKELDKKIRQVCLNVIDDKDYFLSGWYGLQKEDWRWMSNSANILFEIPAGNETLDFLFLLKGSNKPFSSHFTKPQVLKMYCNDRMIGKETVPDGAFSLSIPVKLTSKEREAIFRIEASNSLIPREHNINSDTRRLSVVVTSVGMKPN